MHPHPRLDNPQQERGVASITMPQHEMALIARMAQKI